MMCQGIGNKVVAKFGELAVLRGMGVDFGQDHCLSMSTQQML